MFDSFPYDEWSDTVTDFWTFGGANSTGTYIMTVLGCILMVASIIGWVVMEKRKLERQAASLRASGAFDAPPAPTASAGD
jgi:predicted negative regulator of RcsB-dependent stress response